MPSSSSDSLVPLFHSIACVHMNTAGLLHGFWRLEHTSQCLPSRRSSMVSQDWEPRSLFVLCKEASTVLSSVSIWIRFYRVLTERLRIPLKHHLFGERDTKLFIPLVKRMRACHILVLRSDNWCTGHRSKEVTIFSIRVNDKEGSG